MEVDKTDLTKFTKTGAPRVRKRFDWTPGPKKLKSTVIHNEARQLTPEQQQRVLDFIEEIKNEQSIEVEQ